MLPEFSHGAAWARKAAIGFLFSLCVLFLVERGPYRAVRFDHAYDFSTLYASARCWLKGENPYDGAQLKHELLDTGAPQRLVYQQDLNPAVYLVSAMPIAAPLAFLRWGVANLLWSILSVLLFAVSLFVILKHTNLSVPSKWIAASIALLFCPTYVGLLGGNPSVISISLVSLAVCLPVDGRAKVSGLLLGIALCLKPQIAICGICVLAIRRYWIALVVAFATFAVIGGVGLLVASSFGQSWQWWATEQQNMAMQFGPRGIADPGPTSPAAFQFLDAQTLMAYVTENPLIRSILAWIAGTILLLAYLRVRSKAGAPWYWRDTAFFAVITLVVTYHRYYDGQILLLLIPLLVTLWKRNDRVRVIALSVCLLSIAFPNQSVLAEWLGPAATKASIEQFVLLRHYPVALLVISGIVALSGNRKLENGK